MLQKDSYLLLRSPGSGIGTIDRLMDYRPRAKHKQGLHYLIGPRAGLSLSWKAVIVAGLGAFSRETCLQFTAHSLSCHTLAVPTP
jgi:hypothetical protein